MARVFHSTAFQVTPRSASVRTTIPAAVAAILGVEHLSSIVWSVEPGTSRVYVSVEPPEASSKKSSKRD